MGGSIVNKSSYVWICIFALCFMFLGHATTGTAGSSLGIFLGEFIGSFFFIYVCVWTSYKIKRILKKPTQ